MLLNAFCLCRKYYLLKKERIGDIFHFSEQFSSKINDFFLMLSLISEMLKSSPRMLDVTEK